MKFPTSLPALKAANNILFGLSLLTGIALLIHTMLQPAPSPEGIALKAAEYSWLGFLSSWVVSMLAGFVCEFFQTGSMVLAWILRASCIAGIAHVVCVPAVFLT